MLLGCLTKQLEPGGAAWAGESLIRFLKHKSEQPIRSLCLQLKKIPLIGFPRPTTGDDFVEYCGKSLFKYRPILIHK